MSNEKTKPIGLRIPLMFLARLKKLAKANKRTLTAQILIMLERQIDANPF